VGRKISALRVGAAHLGDVTWEALDDYVEKNVRLIREQGGQSGE
jgi:hypothetical protein